MGGRRISKTAQWVKRMLKDAINPAFRTVGGEAEPEPSPVEVNSTQRHPVTNDSRSSQPIDHDRDREWARVQNGPGKTWEPWRIRQFNESLVKIHELQRQLGEVEQRMRRFRVENMAMMGAQLVIRCSAIDARKSLDQEWNGILARQNELMRQFRTALAEHAALKLQEEPNAIRTLSRQ